MNSSYLASVIVSACLAGVMIPSGAVLAADARVIYRCEINGVLTFSDHPCGESVEVHRSSDFASNTYAAPAPPVRRTEAVSRAPKPRAKSVDADVQKRREACARLDRQLNDIRSKMRAGYSATQGERLKERQISLREQSRDLRCS